MPVALTSRERARLKARAHEIDAVVQVGQGGVTEAVVTEVDRALAAHELIKVRIGIADRHARAAFAGDLRERTDSAIVQQIGKILVLWRPRPDDTGS